MTLNLPPAVPADLPDQFSWWQNDIRSSGPAPIARPLHGPHTADVAIVGGGFTGLWTALSLKERRPELSVTILESHRCGDGASSRAGGNVHGYWSALPTLVSLFGPDRSLEIIRLGTLAQDRIRRFATAKERDLWWAEEGYLRVATSDYQKGKLQSYLAVATQLGAGSAVHHLRKEELAAFCMSPQFEEGLFFEEGATVHPARLAGALRDASLQAGVRIFEQSPVRSIEKGPTNEVKTAQGVVSARSVVLATYTGTMALPQVARGTALFSSFPVMSHADPDLLERMNYSKARGIADMRMFAHYFRRTRDGRILMGSGSGPIAYGGRHLSEHLRADRNSTVRAETGLNRFFPGMKREAAAQWGFPIEVASDRIPYFGNVPATRIYYGSGYSGHGINASVIAGACLSSLVLDQNDQWTTSPFCKRARVVLPPEPFRYLGARPIQRSIVACEDADDAKKPRPPMADFLSRLPGYLGLRIGTR